MEKFLGIWYEMTWIAEEWLKPEDLYTDYVYKYTTFNDTVIDIEWYAREVEESGRCLNGRKSLTKTPNVAKFIYRRELGLPVSPYWVIKTDYDNYALTYGCRNVSSTSGECVKPDAWMWSRKPTLSATNRQEMEALLPSLCLQSDQFVETEHGNGCIESRSSISEVSVVGVVLAFLTTKIF